MNTDNFQWTDELAAEYGQYYHAASNNLDHYLPKNVLEEFKASKQKPKEWEILSFKQNSDIRDLWLPVPGCDGGLWALNGRGSIPYKTEEILNNPLYSIHSVRRLSDGEVFTVGERATYGIATAPIEEFSITDDRMYVTGGEDAGHSFGCFLAYLSKPKQPLFTTEDGKPVYKGDQYVKVNNYSDWSIVTGFEAQGSQDNYKGLKFSTKEAAEEYVLLNKPLLSVGDIISLFSINLEGDAKKYATEQLKQLAKSKLQ